MKIFASVLLVLITGALYAAPSAEFDTAMRVFETLSSDAMQGRRTGTPGGDKAREFLTEEINKLNVFDKRLQQTFNVKPRDLRKMDGDPVEGTNLIGLLDVDDGDKGPLLIVTAHYDHIGVNGDGEIFNGADDNASGSAALFAIAQSFKEKAPEHDIMIVWLDAEEQRLQGAFALVKQYQSFNGRPVFNLNLDMVSQHEDTIYYSGSYHYPLAKPLIEAASKDTNITVLFGNDSPKDGPNDWTNQSDHAAFHAVGIPFGYFGVEDHPHYHRVTDEFDTIPQAFYKRSVQTIVNAVHLLDKNLDTIAQPAKKVETK